MFKILGRMLLAVSLGVATAAVFAAPASAAGVPVCSDWKQVGAIKAPVSSSGNTYCWMQRGHYTRGVWMLQYSINMCYGAYLRSIHFPYEVAQDNDFGPVTEAALREVQKLEDSRYPGVEVVADGVYGYVTAHTMFHSTGKNYDCYRL